MDMMHFSPLCMGLAHEWQNAYWIFNGHHSSIDRYDFKADHGPGEDDHSDGEILRYIKGEVRRVPGVSSQMHYDKEEDYLYIADTGNRRILRLDARSGEQGAILLPNYDEGRVHHEMDNAEFIELVNDERIMGRPSGLFLDDDGTIYVSDPEYSEFKAFDKEGNLLRMLKTDFPLDSLGTLAKGGDGRLYFTQPQEGRVYRIEFDPTGFTGNSAKGTNVRFKPSSRPRPAALSEGSRGLQTWAQGTIKRRLPLGLGRPQHGLPPARTPQPHRHQHRPGSLW